MFIASICFRTRDVVCLCLPSFSTLKIQFEYGCHWIAQHIWHLTIRDLIGVKLISRCLLSLTANKTVNSTVPQSALWRRPHIKIFSQDWNSGLVFFECPILRFNLYKSCNAWLQRENRSYYAGMYHTKLIHVVNKSTVRVETSPVRLIQITQDHKAFILIVL